MSLLNPFSALQTLGIAAIAVGLAWGAGELHGHSRGVDSKQAEWDADKLEKIAAQQAADEAARLRSHAADLAYDRGRTARLVRAATATKEIDHVLETESRWRDGLVPDGVRRAIAAAVGQASAASQPDGAMRVPAARDPDERATGQGLRVGPRQPGRLFGPASAPR